jgi:hypothetical protein
MLHCRKDCHIEDVLEACRVFFLSPPPPQPVFTMSFALAFGSFGDFVSTIQLLYQLQQALCNAGSSLMQYQALVDRIGTFQHLLVQAGQLQLRDISPALKNALNLHISQAEEATKAFFLHIRGYHASLSPGGTGQWFRDTWRKVKWKIGDGDVKEFIERMKEQAIAIGLLLSTANVFVCSNAVYSLDRLLMPPPTDRYIL